MELPVRPKSGRVQRQERLTTRRDIISNDVPVEMLQRIFSCLHDPGDERWTGKEDLKAVSLTCKKFRAAGMRDLCRDMTLKFMYTYDWDQGHWKAPKLVELVKRRPEMKALVRTLRLIVIPLDDESIIQLMTRPAYRVREEQVAHIEKRLDRLPNQFAPCVSDHPDNAQRAAQDGTMDGDTQEARFIRYFGRASGNPKQPIQEVAKSVYRRKKKRQVFADYVCTDCPKLSQVSIIS